MSKKVLCAIILIVVLIICLALFFLLRGKPETEVNVEATPVPFVEANNMETVPADATYEGSVYVYTVDGNGNKTEIEDSEIYPSKMSYRCYDYSVSEADENGYVTHTFKVDASNPRSVAVPNTLKQKWSYSSFFTHLIFFDYNTGDCYKRRLVSLDNKTDSFSNPTADETGMSFTTINWNGKTFEIGAVIEFTSNTSAYTSEKLDNNKTKYSNTVTYEMTVKIYAPKDYDGIMVAVPNIEYSSDYHDTITKLSNRYEELKKEFEETGETSEEYEELDNTMNKTITLFESRIDPDLKFTKDNYYIFKLSSIPPVSEE